MELQIDIDKQDPCEQYFLKAVGHCHQLEWSSREWGVAIACDECHAFIAWGDDPKFKDMLISESVTCSKNCHDVAKEKL